MPVKTASQVSCTTSSATARLETTPAAILVMASP
jgi:hypothetical protein